MPLLLLFLALFGDPHPRTYRLRATHALESGYPSCGATERMLKDHHRVTFEGDTVKVNYTMWKVIPYPGSEYGDVWFYYSPNPGQNLTEVRMHLLVNDRRALGRYILEGQTPDRKFCRDIVEVSGYRE